MLSVRFEYRERAVGREYVWGNRVGTLGARSDANAHNGRASSSSRNPIGNVEECATMRAPALRHTTPNVQRLARCPIGYP